MLNFLCLQSLQAYPAADRIDTSEYFQQVFETPSSPEPKVRMQIIPETACFDQRASCMRLAELWHSALDDPVLIQMHRTKSAMLDAPPVVGHSTLCTTVIAAIILLHADCHMLLRGVLDPCQLL